MLPTQQVTTISREIQHSDSKPLLLSILAQEYETNNIGLAKAKKWITKVFNIFDDEIEGLMYAHNDLGEVVYYLDSSAETNEYRGIQSINLILNLNCSKIELVN